MLLLISYLGGVLTILSPCILPVLPFVFARAGANRTATLAMLVGMALAFAAVGSLAAIGGAWVVQANELGRLLALTLLLLFGIALVSPSFAAWLSAPAVALGNRLSAKADGAVPTIRGSALLGVATGLLWAPCAGPILGLVLSGAALQGASFETTFLLLAYGAGAATSLALAILVGGRVLAALKRFLGAGEWLRRALGVAVIASVAAIGLGVDTNLLARLSITGTTRIEQALIDLFGAGTLQAASGLAPRPATATFRSDLPVRGPVPPLESANDWLSSPPLTREGLRGKVVLVHFWTYSCINCIRTLPYIRAWEERYRERGLTVVGVHTPEFAFERRVDNVRRALAEFRLVHPIAVDNDYRIWRAFRNRYWPALYLVDANGNIRHQHFGEGGYAETERAIQDLLAEAGREREAAQPVTPSATGIEAGSDFSGVASPETYIGFAQALNFASPEGVRGNVARDYTAGPLRLNQWALSGNWTIGPEFATLNRSGGGIAFRFRARDLHLVLGPQSDGRPIRFQVLVDGRPPGAAHGADTDAEGNGTITATRLYQLVRLPGGAGERTFEIRFLDAGVEAFAFTFG